jgi:hypothetical protein
MNVIGINSVKSYPSARPYDILLHLHMMTEMRPEPWLRGPMPGIPPLLQPPAHALVMALEDVNAALRGITVAQLWQRPGGAASVGFHLMHLAGSTDRLLTYARGESLSATQVAALNDERELGEPIATLDALLARWGEVVQNALRQIAGTPEASLLDHRAVGRAGLPSTVIGLIFHAAEHAQRHVGQIVTTTKIIRGAEQ